MKVTKGKDAMQGSEFFSREAGSKDAKVHAWMRSAGTRWKAKDDRNARRSL